MTGLRRSRPQDPVVARLTTVPGIGPDHGDARMSPRWMTPRASVAQRKWRAIWASCPARYSSGEQQRRGRVMRSAHPYVQSLLVQAAWRVWRSTDPRTAGLRRWAQGIAHRRGKNIAVVALARRLARILFAMWRDGVPYDAARTRPTRAARRRGSRRRRRVGWPVVISRGRQAGGVSAMRTCGRC